MVRYTTGSVAEKVMAQRDLNPVLSSLLQERKEKEETKLFPNFQAQNKFCKALEVNRQFRDEIDSLRVERQRFDNIFKKLDKERQELQQETGKIIDESTQAYDQR